MSKKLVLSVSSYDFKNDDGEQVVGAKITYINKKNVAKKNVKGVIPIVMNVGQSMLLKIQEIPGLYDIDLEEIPGKNGKGAMLSIIDLEFIKSVDIFSMFE